MFRNDDISCYRYSAIRLSTKLDFKAIKELKTKEVISDFKQLTDLEFLKNMDRHDLSESTCRKLDGVIGSWDTIDRMAGEYMQTAQRNKIFTLTKRDLDYPLNWRGQSGMPEVIYCRGNKKLLRNMTMKGAVAVVGSRDASKYALYATEAFSSELSKMGVTIVSGMAMGIDRAAHSASVDEAGSTVAVLAGGPENIYPRENRDIYEQIVEKGLVLSEMPPGQEVLRQYFPARNRLIAGLGDCTLVMEAGEKSGTLHTASYTAAQGKELFVLPNSIYFANAKGGLKLLEDGGNVLVSTDSVVDCLSMAHLYKVLEYPEEMECYIEDEYNEEAYDEVEGRAMMLNLRKKADLNPEEMDDFEWRMIISDELSAGPRSIDELCKVIALPFYRMSQLLISMELSGSVTSKGGKFSLTIC